MKLNKDKVAVLYGYKQLQFGFVPTGNPSYRDGAGCRSVR